jgi:hypothetical protein
LKDLGSQAVSLALVDLSTFRAGSNTTGILTAVLDYDKRQWCVCVKVEVLPTIVQCLMKLRRSISALAGEDHSEDTAHDEYRLEKLWSHPRCQLL